MRKRTESNSHGNFFSDDALIAYYNIVKKTIQDYTDELMRRCRYKSTVSQTGDGTIMDDRSKLIDLYDSCYIQNARLQSCCETLNSQLTGERYSLGRINADGKFERDEEESKKAQGLEFEKLIQAAIDAKLFGYSLVEILPDVSPDTGLLREVNIIERRNVLADQNRVVQRQGIWSPGWDLDDVQFKHNYILINTGGFGLFAATTPLILAQKFVLANWVNFAHTYGQPIIQGKTVAEDDVTRKRLASQIARAATNKVIVTGKDDDIDIKAFTMSNSEKIYDSLIAYVNKEVSNLVLGSESMAGATQSYVGSTKAHEDIFRARVKNYRKYIENVMNEKILPVLKYWGYLSPDVVFKYNNKVDMSNEDKIKIFDVLTDKYEVDPEIIDMEWGIHVGKQMNLMQYSYDDNADGLDGSDNDHHIMSDEEYEKRFGHPRGVKNKINFLLGR
jgi:hypothetical protein